MDVLEDLKEMIEENPVMTSIIMYAIISVIIGLFVKPVIGILVFVSFLVLEGIFYVLKSQGIVDNSFLVSFYNSFMWFIR